MIRRFVNLVEQNFPARSYSLHRLDVAKHLFYPSTADAEAANAAAAKEAADKKKKKRRRSSNGGGDEPPPSRLGTLRRLPPASARFRRFPAAEDEPWESYYKETFALVSPRGSEGRILYGDGGGHCLIHDADEGVHTTVPSLDFPIGELGMRPISFSVPGAAAGKEHESLYVTSSAVGGNSNSSSSRGFAVLDFNESEPHRKWHRLPPPPCAAGGSSATIQSFTVLDGGATICVSSAIRRNNRGTTHATYCFDTASREWRHAGDWALPFDGRAEHVPELDTWIGFCPQQPIHLCAADLSGITAAGGAGGETAIEAPPPALQHVWEDFNPPAEEEWSKVLNRRYPEYVLRRTKRWTAEAAELVNLGAGRFCTAKFFQVEGEESVGFRVNHTFDEEFFLVLTGVEVLRGGGGEEEGELRMVRHKSKRYWFPSDDFTIDWVL